MHTIDTTPIYYYCGTLVSFFACVPYPAARVPLRGRLAKEGSEPRVTRIPTLSVYETAAASRSIPLTLARSTEANTVVF